MKKFLILAVFVFGLFLFLTSKNNVFAAVPTPPTNLNATPSCNNTAAVMTFSWTAPSGATSYQLQYSDNTLGYTSIWYTTSSTSFSPNASCTTGPGGCSFQYNHLINWAVKACNSSGCGTQATGAKTTSSCGGTATPIPTITPKPTATPVGATLFCNNQYWNMSSCTTRSCCYNNVPTCSSTLCAAATPTPAPAVWYGDSGTYNTYYHIHPIPIKSGDTCTTVDAQHMCSSIPANTANGEASVAGTCPYIGGDQVTLNGTKYSLGMSYGNCITIAASNVPTPTSGSTCGAGIVCTPPNSCVSGVCLPPTSASGTSTAQYCTNGSCKTTPDGGNCVIFSTFSWPKPADAATNPNYKVTYNIATDSTTYGPYLTTTNTLTTPFKVGTNVNGNFLQCASTNNGNQANTGYACGFLQGKQVTWYVNYTKTGTTTAGKITGTAFLAATCTAQTTCTDPNLPNNPYYACDATNNTCTQYPACGKSTCTGTNDTTTCKPTTPNCDSTPTNCTACAGNANTCGTGSQNCTLTTYQGSTNCVNVTAPQQCTYDRCSDTPGNVCQSGQCVNPNNPSPSNSPSSQPTNSSNPSASPTTPPVSCTLPNLNPHFECQQNTCVAVNTCAQNSGGCTQAGASCGVPAGDTSLSFTIGLDAIGSTGDQPNPNDSSSSNQNPLRPIRNLTVEVLDANYNPVLNKSGIIAYDLDSGKFLGAIDIGKTLTSGTYIVKVVSDGYLKKLIPGAQNIVAGQANDMPEVNLVVGDITQQNTLSILDYNVLMSCSIYSADNGGACNQAPSYKKLSDLEDNGPINQFDYNLFVREYSVQNGQ